MVLLYGDATGPLLDKTQANMQFMQCKQHTCHMDSHSLLLPLAISSLSLILQILLRSTTQSLLFYQQVGDH